MRRGDDGGIHKIIEGDDLGIDDLGIHDWDWTSFGLLLLFGVLIILAIVVLIRWLRGKRRRPSARTDYPGDP